MQGRKVPLATLAQQVLTALYPDLPDPLARKVIKASKVCRDQ